MRHRPPPPPRPNKKATDYASANRGLSEEALFWYGVMIEHEKERGAIGLPPANPEDPDCVNAHREGFENRHNVKTATPRMDDGIVVEAEHHSKRQPRGPDAKFRPVNPEPPPDPKKRGSTMKLSEAMRIARERKRDEREL
jgi:hypothetical protein